MNTEINVKSAGGSSTDVSTSQPTSTILSLSNKENVVSDVKSGKLESKADCTAADNTTSYVSGLKLAFIVLGVSLACFLMLIDTMVISTAIPRITDEFNSLADVGWYASAYQVGSAAPQPLSGKVYTYFNTKWSFLFFFAVFEVGSVICGAAASSTMLIIGRAVAGLGAAGIVNGSIIVISSCAPLEKRPKLIGLTVGVAQLGLAIGPLVGGAFTQVNAWRWVFLINLPIGAITALIILFSTIPETTSKPRTLDVLVRLHKYLDLVGFALFAPAVIQLLLALQYGGQVYSWKSSQVIGLFCGSAATFTAWGLWNKFKGDDALLPHSMIRIRAVWSSALYQAFFVSSLYGSVYYLPIYFQAIHKVNPIMSGVYLLPTIIPELVMAITAGALLMQVGYVIPFAVIAVMFLSTGSGLYALLQPNSPSSWWIGFQILAGSGSGLGLNLAITAVQAVTSGELLPSAMAFIVFAQSIGPAIVLSVCNVIFLESLRSEIPKLASDVNPETIIVAGATKFRDIVPAKELANVLVAYATSIDRVFYLVAASSAACAVFIWGMGWINLKTQKPELEIEK